MTSIGQVEYAGGEVEVSARGSGMAFGQISWSYHLEKGDEAAPFSCDKETLASSENDVLLSLCCK